MTTTNSVAIKKGKIKKNLEKWQEEKRKKGKLRKEGEKENN